MEWNERPMPLLDKVLTLPLKKKPKVPKPPRTPRASRRRVRTDAAAHALPAAVTRALAWGVHFYTALGLVCAAGIAVLLFQGGPEAFRWSFVLMAVATFIDATDGTLARKIKVKEVLPGFDGRKLDDLTDFLTYTALPLVLIWRAGLLPTGSGWVLLLPLLASAYGFCQSEAKTDDGYFLGFPSLWNVVAFYLYILQMNPWASLAVVVSLSVLTFVPSRYLYPSQPGKLNVLCNVLGAAWALLLIWVLAALPTADALRRGTADGLITGLAQASLFYPLFYMAASWVVTVKLWLRKPETLAGESESVAV
jgi:phosphatidylcholine synthase